MHTVLVTGFERFGEHSTNPTEEVVRELPDMIAGARVVTAVLPVEFGRSAEVALRLVAERSPDAVVLTGLAAGRRAVTLERVAINVRDIAGECADSTGAAPRDRAIVEGGPDGIFATLPNRTIVERLLASGIPAELSATAGTFVCNETMYAVLHSLRPLGTAAPPAGFVHVPGVDVLSVAELVRALRVVVETVVEATAAA
ncbi:MAG: pyroglutamyl-peptidase I [Dermatophilaceae bacterium]